jgi:hypothetical protein
MGKLKVYSDSIDELLVNRVDADVMSESSELGNDDEKIDDEKIDDEKIDEAWKIEDYMSNFVSVKALVALSLSIVKRMKGSALSKFQGKLSDIDNEMEKEIDRMDSKKEMEFNKLYMKKIKGVKAKILEEFGGDFLKEIEEDKREKE